MKTISSVVISKWILLKRALDSAARIVSPAFYVIIIIITIRINSIMRILCTDTPQYLHTRGIYKVIHYVIKKKIVRIRASYTDVGFATIHACELIFVIYLWMKNNFRVRVGIYYGLTKKVYTDVTI